MRKKRVLAKNETTVNEATANKTTVKETIPSAKRRKTGEAIAQSAAAALSLVQLSTQAPTFTSSDEDAPLAQTLSSRSSPASATNSDTASDTKIESDTELDSDSDTEIESGAALESDVEEKDDSNSPLPARATPARNPIWRKGIHKLVQLLRKQSQPELNEIYATYTEGDLNMYGSKSSHTPPAPELDRLVAMILCNQKAALQHCSPFDDDINRIATNGRRNLLSLAINLHRLDLVELFLKPDVLVDLSCNSHSTIAVQAVKTGDAKIALAVLRHAESLITMPRTQREGRGPLLCQVDAHFRYSSKLGDILQAIIEKAPYNAFVKEKQKKGIPVTGATLRANRALWDALIAFESDHWKSDHWKKGRGQPQRARAQYLAEARGYRAAKTAAAAALPQELKEEAEASLALPSEHEAAFLRATFLQAIIRKAMLSVELSAPYDANLWEELWIEASQTVSAFLHPSRDETLQIQLLRNAFQGALEKRIQSTTHALLNSMTMEDTSSSSAQATPLPPPTPRADSAFTPARYVPGFFPPASAAVLAVAVAVAVPEMPAQRAPASSPEAGNQASAKK